MLIFDGDYPMAYGGMEINRDLTLPISELRAQDETPGNVAFASLPELRRAGVTAALMKFTVRRKCEGSVSSGYNGAEACHAAAKGQVAYYHILAERGEGVVITTSKQLAQQISSWEKQEERTSLPVGFVLGMEGSDPVLHPEQVHEWWGLGVRVASLTHYGPSAYAHGTGTEGGLRGEAVALLKEMQVCGMLLDMTHIDDQSFWEALEHYSGPILASHQNCRALAPGQRQFSDEQLKVVIDRGGVIGASMDTWMLCPEQVINWATTKTFTRRDVFTRESITLGTLANHIDHVCQLAGNSDHAAIGGDTDGQGGVDGAPYEIDTVADYQRLGPILSERGYSDEDVAKIMYRNWQRFYQEHLPAD